MGKTTIIMLSTGLILGLTLLITNLLQKRKRTSMSDWEVADRDLPYYVVIGTQLATAMGGGVLVGHVGNAYNFGLSILCYGGTTFLRFPTWCSPSGDATRQSASLPQSCPL